MIYYKTAVYSEAEAVADELNAGHVYTDGVTLRRVDVALHGGFYFVPLAEPVDGAVGVSYAEMAAHFDSVEVI